MARKNNSPTANVAQEEPTDIYLQALSVLAMLNEMEGVRYSSIQVRRLENPEHFEIKATQCTHDPNYGNSYDSFSYRTDMTDWERKIQFEEVLCDLNAMQEEQRLREDRERLRQSAKAKLSQAEWDALIDN